MSAPLEPEGLFSRRLDALRRAVVAEVRDVNRLIFHVLRGGTVATVACLLAAFLALAVGRGLLPSTPVSFSDLSAQLAALTPAGLLSLGILLLILTPVARVALSLLHFGREKDAAYVLITAIVLANLLLGLLLGVA